MTTRGHFAVVGDLTIRSVERLLDPLVAGSDTHGGSGVQFDLTQVTVVTPAAMTSLAAILESLGAGTPSIVLLPPENDECRRYLAAAGFGQAMDGVGSISGAKNLIEDMPSHARLTLLPLTRLVASEEIPQLLESLEKRLDDMLGCGDDAWEPTKRAIISTIRELCENVFQHAGGPPAWIAAQKYRNKYDSRDFIEVAIGDAGRGIRRSLSTQHTELLKATDGEAIQRMLEERLTRHTNPYRGTGYYVLQCATKQLDGSFRLRSGSGAVQSPRHGTVQMHDDLAPWPGTHLQVRLTCP